MARLTNNSALGSFSGKLGNVVVATWKGIPYVRSRPSKRTGPISKEEKNNREKFKKAQLWLKPLLDFVRIGFRDYSPTVVGFNAAKSWLMKNAMEQTEDGIVIHPSRVLVSYGDLPLPANLRMGKLENEELHIHWDVIEKDHKHMYDQCMLLAYDIYNNANTSMKFTGQFRHTGSDTLYIFSGKKHTYHIYAAFIAADRSRLSNSVYLGEITT